MEAVGEEAAARNSKGVGRRSSGVRQVSGEGVAGIEGEPPAAVARELYRAARVVAHRSIHDALDHCPGGIGAIAADLRVAGGVGRDLVQVFHGFKVLPVAAGIRQAHAEAVAQVLLQGQVPLLHGRVLVVDGEGVVEVGGAAGAACRRVEGIGEREQRRHAARVVVLVIGGQIAGVDGPARDQRETQRRLDETSPAAANDGLVVGEGPPGKAQARTPIRLVCITKRFWDPCLRSRHDRRGRNGAGKLRRLKGLACVFDTTTAPLTGWPLMVVAL